MDYPIEKQISIEARVLVQIRVNVRQMDDGSDLEIVGVRSVTPPTAQEIYESMDSDDFEAMSKAFASAVAGK